MNQRNSGINELSLSELDAASGGMIWDRNHRSPNVLDARGGQFKLFGITVSLDVNGKVSGWG